MELRISIMTNPNTNPDYCKDAEKTALVRLCGVLGVLTENNDLATAALLAATRIERLEKKIPALNVDLAEASTHAYNGEIARMKLEAELASRINELHYANTVCMEQKHKIARLTAGLAELRERTRWIPVSEGLPEDSGRYICAIRYNEEPKKMWVEQRFWNIFGWDMYTSIVTHWMPLPEPPEATDADN
jgi:hypothetical protein